MHSKNRVNYHPLVTKILPFHSDSIYTALFFQHTRKLMVTSQCGLNIEEITKVLSPP